MRMSDMITAYILSRMENESTECVELRRNDLASELGCVPSQINYVLGSRFTPEQGYIVESRRGEGGYIRIKRVCYPSQSSMIAHVVNTIGNTLSFSSAQSVLQSLLEREFISLQTANAMMAAISDQALRDVPPSYRNTIRSTILKYMLTAIVLP